jgi:hypothetical protein
MARFGRATWLLVAALAACTEDPTIEDGGAGSSSGSSTTTGDVPVEAQAEVVTYETQPMVVDLVLTPTVPATAFVSHPDDPGVRVEELADDDETTMTFRVRGLAPATEHRLQFQVVPTVITPGVGDGVLDEISFTTPAALPGHIGAFQLETSDIPPEPLYRMFDHAGFPTGPTTGFFAVDEVGITRFYLGIDNQLAGPTMVWAAVNLLEDGTLLFLRNETLYHMNELGETLLEIPAADMGLPSLHHDVLVLPNGNYLALSLAFEDHTYPDLGDTHVAGDLIVEFTPEGEIVWEWNCFDHLDPLRIREDPEAALALPIIDPATGEESLDWTHANGLIYEEDTDTVIISFRHQDWIVRLNHDETGAIVWKLGFEGDFTLADGDLWFYHPHSPQWQPDGSLLLYDNAIVTVETPPEGVRSRAVRYEIDEEAMTATVAWQDDEEPFFAPIAGDADRMPGGHLLVLDSSIVENITRENPLGDIHSRLREVDPEASPTRVWSIITPKNQFAYRATAHDRLPGMTK